MPYINIKITKEETPVTTEQKQQLIEGVTTLLQEVLGKNPKTTVVVIDEIDMENYGLGGESIKERRKRGE
jgi:4-oxalocrotonate tautomerase